jgi:probable HAF family extracellular repeat protein
METNSRISLSTPIPRISYGQTGMGVTSNPGRLAFLVLLTCLPFTLQAQHQPSRGQLLAYKLVEIGTFGGRNSTTNGGSVIINKQGTLVGSAETSATCPYIPDAAVSSPFKWENGRMTALPRLPGGCGGLPIAINSPGIVVGAADNGVLDPITGQPEIRAVVWVDGKVFDLGTFGGANSLAGAINDAGQVVGVAQKDTIEFFNFGDLIGLSLSPTEWRAFLWEKGELRDLGTLGGSDSAAAGDLALNERGQIAGLSTTNFDVNPTTGFPTVDTFLWEKGHMFDLGTLGGTIASPRTINNRGQVVGLSLIEGDEHFHPYISSHGQLRDLGTLGGSFGAAGWINDKGEVLGASTIKNELLRTFIWRRGSMIDLGTVNNFSCADGRVINGRGQAVGVSFNCSGEGGQHGYIWQNGTIIDLNVFVPPTSDLTIVDSHYINDAGEIAAVGILPDGSERVAVLIPCDGPQTSDNGCIASSVAASRATQLKSRVPTPNTNAMNRNPNRPDPLAAARGRWPRAYGSFRRTQ